MSVTGPVPSGLPSLEVPALSRADVSTLVVAALAVFVVAFSDSILTARSFAARHHEVVDANQSLLAFGVAQISAGVTQGIPVGTSGSRTAVNDDMRATSQVSGVAAAATIAAILMFLTAPIQHLPSAVLGAVIVYAGASLIDPAQWRALARSSRVEVVIAAITVLCVVTIGVLQAIIVAVVLSVADILRRAARPADAVLGWSAQETGTSTWSTTPMRASPRAWSSTASRTGCSSQTPTSSSAGSGRPWTAPPSPCDTWSSTARSSVPSTRVEAALREVIDGLRERNIEIHVARAASSLRRDLDSSVWSRPSAPTTSTAP